MTTKTVNYTSLMVAKLREGYDPEASESEREVQIKDLSKALGKNIASIRAKLTSEGLYVPKAKAPAGKASVRKATIVAAIAATLDVDEDVVGSLEKANKNALVLVYKALAS